VKKFDLYCIHKSVFGVHIRNLILPQTPKGAYSDFEKSPLGDLGVINSPAKIIQKNDNSVSVVKIIFQKTDIQRTQKPEHHPNLLILPPFLNTLSE
jgi:hypothetical protein